jgi:hypothetical protein
MLGDNQDVEHKPRKEQKELFINHFYSVRVEILSFVLIGDLNWKVLLCKQIGLCLQSPLETSLLDSNSS